MQRTSRSSCAPLESHLIMRLGARIQGEPALDEEFGVSDFFILLNRDRMLNRYSKRYLSLT